MRRIEGQVRGLQQMIQDGRYCGDVADQVNAVIAALRRVQTDMLNDHVKACIEASLSRDLPDRERQRLVDEITRLMGDLGRRS
ncbi:metal-sensitive transcriptional regulator [Microvirga splendida]|uniref:metal-sensitive transcriptional regulator n=1 Tax=Microvirga splendida TaxID=2795727 RepID=UPI001FEF5DF5|nr:metal-sensitive transcriptional regulator [Microvirga splendida]